MGIGGTGSVTVTATLANAARLEGKHVIGLDQTGLAQKGGAVISDIKITNRAVRWREQDLGRPHRPVPRLRHPQCDRPEESRQMPSRAHDRSGVDDAIADRPDGVRPPRDVPGDQCSDRRHRAVTRRADNVFLDGQALADGLFGDSMATNTFMVGVAYQAGTIPLKAESIETAIKQAGVGVEMGLAAFHWGRMAVVDRAFVAGRDRKGRGFGDRMARALSCRCGAGHRRCGRRARGDEAPAGSARPRTDRLPERGLHKALRQVVKRVVAAERRAVPGKSALSEAAARYSQADVLQGRVRGRAAARRSGVLAKLQAQFKYGYKVKYNLAPPMISKRDPVTGELQKREFGPWMLTAFRMLAKMKGLRAARWILRKTKERRHERQLIEDYIGLLDEIAISSMRQTTPRRWSSRACPMRFAATAM